MGISLIQSLYHNTVKKKNPCREIMELGPNALLLCLAVLLLIIALIAWGVMNFFQKEKLEMVQENQGTFEVVMVNDEEE